jgi:hypothetical protein
MCISRPEASFLKAEQAASPLTEGVNKQGAEEQADGNADGNLDHGGGNVENERVDGLALLKLDARGSVDTASRVGDEVGSAQAAEQASSRSQTSGHLGKNGGDEGRGSNAVLYARIQVGQDADGQGAEGIRDLRSGGELAAREEVDEVAGKGDNGHDGHLTPLCLVEDGDGDVEEGHKGEGVVRWHGILADGGGGGVGVDEAVEGGADGDAEAKEEGVDDGVDDADGAGDEGAGLEFEGGAHWDVRVLFGGGPGAFAVGQSEIGVQG